MRISILSLVFLLLISTLSYTQQATPLKLQSVSLTADAVTSLSNRARAAQSWQEYTFQGETFLIVQFAELPSIEERKHWEGQGLRFIQYLPDRSYLVGLSGPLSPSDLPFPILLPMLGTFKIAGSCATAINRSSGTVNISVHPMPGLDARALLSGLPTAFKPEKHQKGFLEGIVEVEAIPAIAAHPGVWLIEEAEQSPVPEGLQNGAVVGAPIVHNITEGAFTGENVVIGIADDGNVFHKDLKNRLIVDLSDDFGTSHGEMTTSIAAGAGNLLPEAQGLAPAAKIHLSFILDYLHHEAAGREKWHHSWECGYRWNPGPEQQRWPGRRWPPQARYRCCRSKCYRQRPCQRLHYSQRYLRLRSGDCRHPCPADTGLSYAFWRAGSTFGPSEGGSFEWSERYRPARARFSAWLGAG